MATFRKRGDMQWQAIVKKKGYPTQRKTFMKKRDAQAWARMIELEMERGEWQTKSDCEADRTTLSQALDRYAREISSTKKGEAQEVQRIKAMQRRPIAGLILSKVGGRDIACYRDMRLKSVAPSSVIKELAIISHLFTICRKEWGMESLSNPVSLIRKPVVRDQRDRRLIADEEKRLIEECKRSGNIWIAPMVLFALETAMRKGEILSLQWKDVDLTKKTATLHDTKNGEKRIVPLSPAAIEILRTLPRSIRGRVFATEPSPSQQCFVRACKRAEINDLRFHDLRHESISRLFESGLDIIQVRAISGHKSLKMLIRYTHLKPEDLADLLAEAVNH